MNLFWLICIVLSVSYRKTVEIKAVDLKQQPIIVTNTMPTNILVTTKYVFCRKKKNVFFLVTNQ